MKRYIPKVTINNITMKLPNITFSLIRELALREVVIPETVSSYTEVVFIVHQKDINTVLESFTKKF
jgi:hypothetical protein